jgi:hypothetical protein
MKTITRLGLGLGLIFFGTTNVLAMDDDSFANYESIVNDLRASADTAETPPRLETDWDEVAIHGGLGATLSYVHVQSPFDGATGTGLMKGFEGHVGFNLFTRISRGELLFRNFSPETLSRDMQVDMNEFELRLVFLPRLRDRLLLRMGTGLSARHVNVESRDQSGVISQSHVVSSILVGLERNIAREVSLGPDVTYRTPIRSGSVEKSSWDASFRLNATF